MIVASALLSSALSLASSCLSEMFELFSVRSSDLTTASGFQGGSPTTTTGLPGCSVRRIATPDADVSGGEALRWPAALKRIALDP